MTIETNFDEFCLQLDNANKEVKKAASLAAKWLVFDIYRGLSNDPIGSGELGTPINTRRANASWFVSSHSPSNDVISEDEHPSIAKSLQALNAVSFSNPYQAYFITNNTPYIETLNKGSSAQAPEDFVGKIVAASLERFKQK